MLPPIAARGPLERLLGFATPGGATPAYASLSVSEILTAVKNVSARPWVMREQRCLREGLLAFRFLALAGYRPVLHFGVAPETAKSNHPRAHCWISLDGKAIFNPPTEPMLNLLSYNGQEAIPASGSSPDFEVADV